MMRRSMTLPLRQRLTLVFAVGTAVTLAAIGVFVYLRTAADLLDTVEAGLRSRAAILVVDARRSGPASVDVGSGLIEPDEAFAQVADATGEIVRSNDVVRGTAMLATSVIRAISAPTFFDRDLPGIDNVSRLLAVPVQTPAGRAVVIVGSSLQDRADQLLQLAVTLGIGAPVALLLLSLAGWWLAGAALAPVERMRSEAAAISSTDPRGRLSLPPVDDEITRLGATMNDLLDRVQASVEAERRFVDDASHELRTPLAILKTELDLSLARERSPDELRAALRSAAEETDHLVRLAEDLLILARAHGGHLPVRGTPTDLRQLLEAIAGRHQPRANDAGVAIDVHAASTNVCVDQVRVRQAIDDLLDNALRYTSRGGGITVSGSVDAGTIRLTVTDSGPGFSADVLSHAFEPFVADPDAERDGKDGSGLGLAIVRVIAVAHGGSVQAENPPGGGACVTMTIAELT
jgi:two-component system, OmpR family, sensor kinase